MQPSICSNQNARRMMAKFPISPTLSWCWILLCGTLSILVFLVVGRAPETFNADVGSETVLAKALIDSGNIVISPDFVYSTEVQVVGHHLLLEIGMLLFPHDWMLARVFTLVVIMCFLVASFRYCALSLGVWERSRWIAGLLLLPFSIIYRNFYLYGMFYTIRLCVYFVGFGLCMRCRKSSIPYIVMLMFVVVLGFAFGISGFRMLLLCFTPLLVTFASSCIIESSGDTLKQRLTHIPLPCMRSLGLAATIVLSSIVGMLVNVCFIGKKVVYTHWNAVSLQQIVPSKLIDFATVGFIQSWGSVEAEKAASSIGLASLCGTLTSLAVVVSVIVCIRRRQRLAPAQQLYILFALISFVLSVTMYYLGDQQQPRYLASAVIPLVLLVPITIGLMQRDQLLRSLAAIGFTCLVLMQSVGYGFWPAIVHARSGEPYDEEKVVSWLLGEGFSAGYASFWNCNNMIEISNGALDIWCVADDDHPDADKWWSLKPYEWMAEKRHSEEEPEGRVFLLLTQEEYDRALVAGINMGEAANAIGRYRIFSYDSARELHDALGAP